MSPEDVAATPARAPGNVVWLMVAAIVAAALLAYAPVRSLDFVSLDDPDDVTLNPHVHGGFTPENVRWAFTSTDTNWFPLTRLSHMLDFRLFRAAPAGHHLMSLLIHIVASLLLLGFLLHATRARWPSVFSAFVFALHPLHVESVAWVAERKDVLCALFFFLTLWLWTGYVGYPSRRRYLLTLFAFALGWMSKPMIVSLPILLLLLDRWPFERQLSWRLIVEKLPFFALSALGSAATVVAQREGNAVRTLSEMSLGLRLENSALAVAHYLTQTAWPVDLAVLYPFPAAIPLWQAITATLVVIAVSCLALFRRKLSPWLFTGWFWFLVSLLPVIGLVQVGLQSHADRYMYIPMVGLSIAVSWGVAELLRHRRRLVPAVAMLAVCSCLSMMAGTRHQLRYWTDTETLFRHAIDAVPANYATWFNLGVYLTGAQGRQSEAMACYRAVLRIRPCFAAAHSNLAELQLKAGKLAEALAGYQEALRCNPRFAQAESGLGIALMSPPANIDEAFRHLLAAVRIDPGYAAGYYNLGTAYVQACGTPFGSGL